MQYLNASLKHWLKLQCQALGIVKSAIFVNFSEATPQIIAKWPDASAKNPKLLDALKQLRQKQRLHLAVVSSDELVLAQPLVIEPHFRGGLVLELATGDKKQVPLILKQLQTGQVWLQLLLHQDALSSANRDVEILSSVSLPTLLANRLVALSVQLLKQNSLQEMAISLVNLLATELKATRVSLGLVKSGGLILEAVSFSASFDKRTASMSALVDVMLEAIDQSSQIIYPPQDTNEPATTLITQAHQQLLHIQQLQRVQTFPVRKEGRILGALTCEFADVTSITDEAQQFIAQALMLVAGILDLHIQTEAGLWQKLSRRLTLRFQRWFGTARWKLKLVGLIAVILFAVIWIPADYSVGGDASLQSLEKHLVVSPQDAYLGAIHARPGDRVEKGQLLAQLKDDDLRLERRKFISQVQQYRQAYDAALANANRVEAAIADAQQEQANIQLRLVEHQLERTRLLAPVDGLVVSDDISQTLGAPVKQGETLFEIAALQGFFVQMYVDERDIAGIASGQEGLLKLSSLPGESFALRVKAVTPLSEVRDGRNYFRVDAELMGESAVLRPGMSGTGKIEVGRRPLGWIWFHDLWHWLRLNFW